jgi:hypothetical protein
MASSKQEIEDLIKNLCEKIENENPTKEEVKNRLSSILGKGNLGDDNIHRLCLTVVLKNRTDLVKLIFKEKAIQFDPEDLSTISYVLLWSGIILDNFEMFKLLVEEMHLDVNGRPENQMCLILTWAISFEPLRSQNKINQLLQCTILQIVLETCTQVEWIIGGLYLCRVSQM